VCVCFCGFELQEKNIHEVRFKQNLYLFFRLGVLNGKALYQVFGYRT
jgi:hypothetical protein